MSVHEAPEAAGLLQTWSLTTIRPPDGTDTVVILHLRQTSHFWNYMIRSHFLWMEGACGLLLLIVQTAVQSPKDNFYFRLKLSQWRKNDERTLNSSHQRISVRADQHSSPADFSECFKSFLYSRLPLGNHWFNAAVSHPLQLCSLWWVGPVVQPAWCRCRPPGGPTELQVLLPTRCSSSVSDISGTRHPESLDKVECTEYLHSCLEKS